VKIAVDAREIERESTGVGRYLSEILKNWDTAFFRGHDVTLYFKTRVPDLSFLEERRVRSAHFGPDACPDLWWEQMLLPRRLKEDHIDVFWGAGGSCSRARGGWKNVVNIYDLTFFVDPCWFSAREALVRRWKTAVSAHRADRLITLSDATTKDLGRFLSVPGARVSRIYAGADHVPENGCAKVRPAGTPRGRVLFVGSLLNRRPVENLLRAVAALKDCYPALSLTVVGDNRTRPRKDFEALARDLGVGDRVRFRGYVDESELRAAYGEADLFCYPSLYEGFGIPVVEAQRRGLPVLTLKNSSLVEIAGDSVHYAAGSGAAEISSAMETLLADPRYCDDLERRGLENARRFRWSEAARAVQTVLEGSLYNRIP